jgi:hypothetical protein
MKKIYLLAIFICVTHPLSAQDFSLSDNTTLIYSGYGGYSGWYFAQEAPVRTFPDYVNTIKAKLDITLQFQIPLELNFNQRLQWDTADKNRNRYEIEDLSLDYFSEYWELKAGWQIFSWKAVESISHADFLNQTDLESDFLDAPKFSEPALRFRYILPFDAGRVFEFYYLPLMRATRFPVADNRFSFLGADGNPLNISNKTRDHSYQGNQNEWQPQFALSYQQTFFESVDTRWFYFNGYNRFPGLLPNQSFTEFRHEYRLVQKAGVTFQGQINAWLLKGELVYTDYRKEVFNLLNQTIRPTYFSYTSGFEYTFYSPLIDNHDVGTILEVIGDSDSGKKYEELESYRPFQNHLFGGIRYAFNNVSDRSILMGGFYNYRDNDIILSIEYSERLLEKFTLEIRYIDIRSDTRPISQFDHTDRFVLELLYNF